MSWEKHQFNLLHTDATSYLEKGVRRFTIMNQTWVMIDINQLKKILRFQKELFLMRGNILVGLKEQDLGLGNLK